MLVIAGAITIISFLFEVHLDGQVGLRGIPNFTLPPLCLSHELFKIDCPGCGLTRSFVYLAHGCWKASWRAHHLGWLIASILLLQIPYRLYSLLIWPDYLLSIHAKRRIGQCIIYLLICNWLIQIPF